MAILKIVCPNCRSLLSIQDAPGIGDKMLACPICRFRAKVSVYQQQASGTTKKAAAPDNEEPTQVNFDMMDRTIGSLFFGDEEFSLHKGQNTIGRKAQSGHAEVQISNDPYMSRQHAIITIKEGNKGLDHHLQPTNPKNPIRINGTVLQNADIVKLNWGDRLVFGHTELVFDRPNSNNENTLISQ